MAEKPKGKQGTEVVRIFTHNLCGPHSDNKNRLPEDAKNMHKNIGEKKYLGDLRKCSSAPRGAIKR